MNVLFYSSFVLAFAFVFIMHAGRGSKEASASFIVKRSCNCFKHFCVLGYKTI